MYMKIKYILTTKQFFAEGPCGRVSHAKGFSEGLVENGFIVKVNSYGKAESFIKNNNILFLTAICFFSFFKEILISIFLKEKIVIRWRPMLPFLFFPFLLFYKNIYFEVNSITGLNSSNKLIQYFVRLSIFLTAKLSKIIVVSENSKKQILSISRAKSIYVMPNGFSSEYLEFFEVKHENGEDVNFVYFGKKQDYYEWDAVYKFFKHHPDLKFHIFGFNEDVSLENVIFYGPFNHEDLIHSLNNIVNPILIIHPDDSELAKSGSPMKLFEYAYLNIPMVVGDSLSHIDSNFNEFIYYKSGRYEDLEESLLKVAKNYELFFAKSQTLKNKVKETYSWRSIIKKWIDNDFK